MGSVSLPSASPVLMTEIDGLNTLTESLAEAAMSFGNPTGLDLTATVFTTSRAGFHPAGTLNVYVAVADAPVARVSGNSAVRSPTRESDTLVRSRSGAPDPLGPLSVRFLIVTVYVIVSPGATRWSSATLVIPIFG